MGFGAKKLAIVVVIAGFFAGGCQKKTTNIGTPEPEPEPIAETIEEREPTTIIPSDEDVFETVDMDLAMKEVFNTIYFEYDQYTLRPEAIQILETASAFMTEHKDVRFLLEGHADERGTNEYNMGLGENRSRTVKEYLVGYGIDPVRIEYTSYGREQPAIPNCPDEACHEKNRRVEWKLLAQ
ncbi:MAG: OmpA family protein [Chitinivibrionales bacterium]|nr:OmpA family protein [Chitinivibrionales bacterium]MBD3358902.1 OmpA family protein [Chitinivibrionales bacterium]